MLASGGAALACGGAAVRRCPGIDVPSRDGATLSHDGAAPSRGGATLSHDGAAFSRGDTTPSRAGAAPSRGDTTPSRAGAAPSRDGATLSRGGRAPNQLTAVSAGDSWSPGTRGCGTAGEDASVGRITGISTVASLPTAGVLEVFMTSPGLRRITAGPVACAGCRIRPGRSPSPSARVPHDLPASPENSSIRTAKRTQPRGPVSRKPTFHSRLICDGYGQSTSRGSTNTQRH